MYVVCRVFIQSLFLLMPYQLTVIASGEDCEGMTISLYRPFL